MGGVFGSIPHLPPWHQLDLGAEQGKAIANNTVAAPGASALAKLTEDQILSMMRQTMPGFDAMTTSAGANINSMLKGEIPADVGAAVQTSAAARSLGSGTAGSGFSKDLVARDLGLTSLGLMDKGLSSAESWMASTERLLSPAMSVFTNMFVTPGEQASFDVSERDKNFAYHWLNNQVQAQADPTASALVGNFIPTTILGRNAPPQNPAATTNPATTDTSGASGADWSKGWETANPAAVQPGGDYSAMGAAGANAEAGVSGGFDWAAATDAYAGFA